MNFDAYNNCRLCPRECGVNREAGRGFCGMGAALKLARAALHFWEEPCISGKSGSGTVFFSGCQLGCVFCQNRRISRDGIGVIVDEVRLCEIFIELWEKGANNINLVSASQYVPHVIRALDIAKKKGLDIPVVYNSGGYESVSTLRMLDGYVDIYLPDFKYMSNKIAQKLSKAADYAETAKAAVDEMVNQTGAARFFDNGIMKSGVIIRHLVLPGYEEDSKAVIKYLFERYRHDVWLSIMNQYTPMPGMTGELSRMLSKSEYDEVVDYAVCLGVENGFIQEENTAKESFIPSFESFEGIER